MQRLSEYQLSRKGRKRPDRVIDGLLFDPEDSWLVSKFYWTLNPWGYAEARVCFVRNKYTRIFLHRILLDAADHELVDHINRNKLDNRKLNLRIVTKQMNSGNMPVRSDNISSYRGVCKTRPDYARPWRAYATLNGKQKSLGSYWTAEEASEVARAWRMANIPGAVD